eukprot:TRINITY_DN7772_c0_g1_i1.p1 TRINITY_DN7772_c0_g1~~TRINITY_DN7772_c0_g1_i1.p1  ORF type:complete len:253 (+),score=49.11 TRINITY_DN7772_c0_g1_i1:169-927(+)
MGLVLCFFGGAYVTTITAAEAFRVVAWEQVKTATLDVWGQYRQAVLKAAEQEPKNETAQQAFTRKVTLAVQGCEPEVVNKALVSGQAGLMAVVAVLRIKFAQTITFGASLATQIKDLVAVGWLPKQLESALAPAYHKWIPTIIDYSCKIFGISCAWTVQRGLFAFHTSIRGGKMLARGGLSFTAKLKGFDAARYEGTPNMLYLEALLAVVGFYAQFVRGFSSTGLLGYVLFPVFLPLNICEFMIGMIIGRAA